MLPEVLFFLEGYNQISKHLTHNINAKNITS